MHPLTRLALATTCLAPALFVSASALAAGGPSPWVGAFTAGNTVFLAEANAAQIDRYDLSAHTWLAPIALPSVPTAFTATADALIVSDATATTRYALDGSNAQVLPGALPAAVSLGVRGNTLFLTPVNRLQSYDLGTLQPIDTRNDCCYQTPYGFAIDTAHGRLVGNQLYVGPPSIVWWTVDANGLFGSSGSTSADFDYPMGARNYLSTDGQSVINSGGVVWSSTNELHDGAVGGYFDALVTSGSNAVVLRDAALYLVDATYHELGRYNLAQPANELISDGSSVYAFSLVGNTPQVQAVPIAAIGTPPLPPAPDPTRGLPVPDDIELGPNGVVYLLSIAQHAIHRFDLNSHAYLPSIVLPDTPAHIAVDPANGDVYIAYTGASVGVLRAGSATVVPFAYTLTALGGIGVAGSSLMTVDFAGGMPVHRLVDKQFGRETATRDWNYLSKEYVWCAARARMYFYTDGLAPNNLNYEDIAPPATIGAPTPDYQQWGYTNPIYPIRVDPSCSKIVNGAGQVFDPSNVAVVGTIGEQPTDIAWSAGVMYDILPGTNADSTTIHRFDAANAITASGTTVGAPLRLLAYGANLYAVTFESQRLLFTPIGTPALDGNDLSVLPIADTAAAVPNGLAAVQFDFLNQGPQASAAAAISIATPPQVGAIAWVCESSSTPTYDCGSNAPFATTHAFAAGERFSVIGYFTTPANATQALQFDATIQAIAGDAVPQNNAASLAVRLDELFHDGFE